MKIGPVEIQKIRNEDKRLGYKDPQAPDTELSFISTYNELWQITFPNGIVWYYGPDLTSREVTEEVIRELRRDWSSIEIVDDLVKELKMSLLFLEAAEE